MGFLIIFAIVSAKGLNILLNLYTIAPAAARFKNIFFYWKERIESSKKDFNKF